MLERPSRRRLSRPDSRHGRAAATAGRLWKTYPPRLRIVLSGPERSRRKRALRRGGLAVYRVVVGQAELEETLRRARNFTDAQLEDRKLVEDELSEILGFWCD